MKMKGVNGFLARYKKVADALPKTNLCWPLYGAGLENLGRAGQPVALSLPEISDEQLLVRVDAMGLCFSDIKLISQGSAHPRIYGRNLRENPVVPGHEASLTVARVGAKLQDRFKVGERYLIQADVFYQGRSLAFGYALPGALQQYTVISREILNGDEGCYLIPVRETDGYAEVALSEPWACVVASYRIKRRDKLRPSGTAWFIINWEEENGHVLEGAFSPEGQPGRVVISGRRGELRNWVARELGELAVVEEGEKKAGELSELHTNGRGFDDIVFFGAPSPEMVEDASKALADGGVLAILAETPLAGKVSIDIGRIHYDRHHYIGGNSKSLVMAYQRARSTELQSSGRTWLIGAGGPMGQMHTQLAVENPSGPSLILVTDIDEHRLEELKKRFAPVAERRRARLVTLNPQGMSREEFADKLRAITEGEFFDDIIVLAPVPALVEDGARWLNRNGLMNIFAGVPRGTMIKMDMSGVYLSGQRWTGSSGSSLADLRRTLEETQKGALSPNNSVAAICGLAAAVEGLQAVRDGRFPGKVVVWPQLPSLPLIPLPELSERLPNVAAKLSPEGFWTTAAEEELLSSQWASE